MLVNLNCIKNEMWPGRLAKKKHLKWDIAHIIICHMYFTYWYCGMSLVLAKHPTYHFLPLRRQSATPPYTATQYNSFTTHSWSSLRGLGWCLYVCVCVCVWWGMALTKHTNWNHCSVFFLLPVWTTFFALDSTGELRMPTTATPPEWL